MEERAWQAPGAEIPRREPIGVMTEPDGQVAADGPRSPGSASVPSEALDDPRALTILTTEHWSLLSARGLVYNEAFSRGGMFLTFTSATFVALGLVSTASGFSTEFLIVAAIALSLDVFIGVATMGRLVDVSREDIRYLQGMNRLRHAYHEMVPGLERYFVTGQHDDIGSVFAMYEVGPEPASRQGVLHGLTTTIGMIGTITGALVGILAAILVLLATNSTVGAIGAAVLGFLLSSVTNVVYMTRAIRALNRTSAAVFPRSRGGR